MTFEPKLQENIQKTRI